MNGLRGRKTGLGFGGYEPELRLMFLEKSLEEGRC